MHEELWTEVAQDVFVMVWSRRDSSVLSMRLRQISMSGLSC